MLSLSGRPPKSKEGRQRQASGLRTAESCLQWRSLFKSFSFVGSVVTESELFFLSVFRFSWFLSKNVSDTEVRGKWLDFQ